MWINKTNYLEKNQECSGALLDLMEYYDTTVPIEVLRQWLYTYLILSMDVTGLVGTKLSVPGLPTIMMLHDGLEEYPNLGKFHHLYDRILSWCKTHTHEPKALEAMNELAVITGNTEDYSDLETIRSWMLKYEYLWNDLSLFYDFGIRKDLTGEFFQSNIEGLDAQLSTDDFRGMIGFAKVYSGFYFGDTSLNPHAETLEENNPE
jgi:hypothetical protein